MRRMATMRLPVAAPARTKTAHAVPIWRHDQMLLYHQNGQEVRPDDESAVNGLRRFDVYAVVACKVAVGWIKFNAMNST